jgi:hypothetical protein
MQSQRVLNSWFGDAVQMKTVLNFESDDNKESSSCPFNALDDPRIRATCLDTIKKVLDLLWKHEGFLCGGFLRDFYYIFMLGIETKKELSNHVPDELLALILQYVYMNSVKDFTLRSTPLTFKDMDVWFNDMKKATLFVCEMIQERLTFDPRDPILGIHVYNNELDTTDHGEVILGVAKKTYGKQRKRKATDFLKDDILFPADRGSPFCKYSFSVPILRTHYNFQIDVIVACELPVNNYTVNLCTLQCDLKGKWKTQGHLPYSYKMQRHYDGFVKDQKDLPIQHHEVCDILWQYFTGQTWRLPEFFQIVLQKGSHALLPMIPFHYVGIARAKDKSMIKRGWILSNM